MAAPFPPQGEQQLHTERPLKVYAEQYQAGHPLPIGAVINPGDPPVFTDDQPRVLLANGWIVLHLTEWVISNRYTGAALEVISDEEMAERFGTSGAPPLNV
jgi:hypothetical protein